MSANSPKTNHATRYVVILIAVFMLPFLSPILGMGYLVVGFLLMQIFPPGFHPHPVAVDVSHATILDDRSFVITLLGSSGLEGDLFRVELSDSGVQAVSPLLQKPGSDRDVVHDSVTGEIYFINTDHSDYSSIYRLKLGTSDPVQIYREYGGLQLDGVADGHGILLITRYGHRSSGKALGSDAYLLDASTGKTWRSSHARFVSPDQTLIYQSFGAEKASAFDVISKSEHSVSNAEFERILPTEGYRFTLEDRHQTELKNMCPELENSLSGFHDWECLQLDGKRAIGVYLTSETMQAEATFVVIDLSECRKIIERDCGNSVDANVLVRSVGPLLLYADAKTDVVHLVQYNHSGEVLFESTLP